MQETESKKNLLMEKLNQKLNSSVHNHIDLNLREICSEQGSLCGMAAIYQALGDTLFTRSAFMRVWVSFCVYVRVCVCLCDVRLCIWLP